MTNENESLVRKSIGKNKMEFPIVLTRGKTADSAYGVRGFPTSVLVDATGAIAWKGHPAELSEATIEGLLADVRN